MIRTIKPKILAFLVAITALVILLGWITLVYRFPLESMVGVCCAGGSVFSYCVYEVAYRRFSKNKS
jgi:hypothetical protein